MSRKGALWMLLAVVLWAAAPAFACLPMMHGSSSHGCCHSAMQDCCGGTMSTPMACCAVQSSSPVATPALLSAFEHWQSAALSAFPAEGFVDLQFSAAAQHPLEMPPLRLSPGGSSILRI